MSRVRQVVEIAGFRRPANQNLGRELRNLWALYADHGMHEQFHSEFKTNLDLERLPSGKFDTNVLMLSLVAVAYNILRLIGQQALLRPGAPLRHPAKRRRLKTVMKEMVRVAARLSAHARRSLSTSVGIAPRSTSGATCTPHGKCPISCPNPSRPAADDWRTRQPTRHRAPKHGAWHRTSR